jgi:predicted nucleic acid-binding protein
VGTRHGGARAGALERWEARRVGDACPFPRKARFRNGDRGSPVTVYLDTSDLVKLYVDESGSAEIQALVDEADVVATSVLAYAEARATFARRRRERLMTTAEAKSVVRQLDADWPRFVTIVCDGELARSGGRPPDEHGIRGADAVHLASFEELLARCDDEELRFSSADVTLTRATRALG